MKTILITAILLLSFQSFSQNYKLFNASSKKVYSNYPLPDSTFSITFDSVQLIGTDSVYFNFTQPGNLITSSNCQFWASPECTKQDRPTWLGSRVHYDNAFKYKFFTLSGDSLVFDFSFNAVGPVLFYESLAEKFFLTFEKTDTITVLNYSDSARFYKITHTDSFGNPVNSPLNGKQLIIGKNLGLVQFLQIDAFPIVLNSVYLFGNISPDLGLAKLTNGIIYDYAVGDVYQYHEIVHYNYGPPGQDADRFIRYTIIDKLVSSDSIFYTAGRYIFEKEASTTVNDTVVLKYKTSQLIAQIPYEYINPDEFFFTKRSMRFENYCGVKCWTYRVNPNRGLGYCSFNNCWGSQDVPGPPPTEADIYTLGMGLYSSLYSEAIINWNDLGYYHSSALIYSQKNGVECGKEAFLGMDENPATGKLFSVYPVPVKEYLTIEIVELDGSWLSIRTVNGQEVMKQQLHNRITQIDLSNLKSGIYLVRLTSDKSVFVEKIIKE
jgi:hypothetical protein